MKAIRKMICVLLAVVMTLALGVTAFAEEAGTTTTNSGTNSYTGSITITNAVVGQTYTIYQILQLESWDESAKAYSYKATNAWKSFVESEAIKRVYLATDDNGYVTWEKDADVVAFAKLAQAYAAENSIKAVSSQTATAPEANPNATTTTVMFSGLNLGYYLVDTTLGTLCSLDTTNPSVTMEEKNTVPTIDKKVKEDSTSTFGDENTAQIGDTVEFKTTVHAKKGAQKYVVHDQMEAGLTLNQNSIEVKVGETALIIDTDYKVSFNVKHNEGEENESTCAFDITFEQTYLDKITGDTDIVITYSAVLNENAEISTDTNDNKTKLDYGENSSTEWNITKTTTYMFDLIKINDNSKLLNGAKFELYDAEKDGNKIDLVKESDGSYRVATTEEKKGKDFTSAVIEAGKVTIKGLDANTTYWLEETEAPAGYNKLPSRVEVKIEETNLTIIKEPDDIWQKDNGGVQIQNKSGTELPSTGGMGTTIFYVLGSVLVIGAVVLLVTKKRMSMES